MLELYYYHDNASLAPHLLLVETQVDYALSLVDRSSNAQKYVVLNTPGYIPTLVKDDLVLFESPANCNYICELDTSSRFIPPLGDSNRSLFFQWLAYLNNRLQAEYMLRRYSETYTTDAKSIAGINAAQDQCLTGIFILLDEELGKKKGLIQITRFWCYRGYCG